MHTALGSSRAYVVWLRTAAGDAYAGTASCSSWARSSATNSCAAIYCIFSTAGLGGGTDGKRGGHRSGHTSMGRQNLRLPSIQRGVATSRH